MVYGCQDLNFITILSLSVFLISKINLLSWLQAEFRFTASSNHHITVRLKKGIVWSLESEIGIPSQYRFCQVLEWNRSFTVSAILSACNATIFNSFLEKLVKKEKKFCPISAGFIKRVCRGHFLIKKDKGC